MEWTTHDESREHSALNRERCFPVRPEAPFFCNPDRRRFDTMGEYCANTIPSGIM